MRARQICSFILMAAAMAGCGGGGSGDDDGTDGGGGGDGGSVDTPIPADYTRLIGRSWTLPAGTPDTYKCVRATLTEDTYITNILSQAPTGSHHAVLSIAGANGTSGTDGEYDCSVGSLGTVMLYASGVGTSPLDFPAGVGVKIAAGTQIHLNLHLYNASDAPISGDSAVLVKRSATAPPTLAEMVFAGKFLFSVPGTPMNQTPVEYSTTGGCTANRDFTLFSLWPHQHKLGTKQKFDVIRGGNTTTLHDAAFDFNEQKYYLQTPEFQVQTGDQLRVTCSWLNPGTAAVPFGDSSDEEMCFTGMYRYPAVGSPNLFQCTDTGGAGF